MNKSYDAVKEHIAATLRRTSGTLPQDKIEEEVSNTRAAIEAVGPEMFGKILSIQGFSTLQKPEWEKLTRELETHFNVKMRKGALIQGDEQRHRDTTWWSSIEKQRNKKYYWSRYRSYLDQSLPPEVVKTIDDDTDMVMNNLENPIHSSFSRYGMVVGHVQSGKTGNYAGLICKAADAGYKFVVVIAGGMNNLRNQTQERLNEAFIGENQGVQVGAGKGNSQKDTLPLSLTTIERDFNKRDADRLAQGFNFESISVPVLIVIKKNTRSLDNVIDWLQKQYKNKVVNHAMLVIDDESDYASINTKDEENPTAINKGIRTLLGLFHKSAYVAYTATPYANIFIDHEAETEDEGRDLFPKDFIYALDAPTNYFGARKIFLDTDDKHLVPVNDHLSVLPLDHKSGHKVSALPEQLKDAIRLFVINIGIRGLRGQQSHNSMLIHASRFTLVHQQIGALVDDYLKLIKFDVTAYGNLNSPESHSKHVQELSETFARHCETVEFTWDKVIISISKVIESVVVREVHQKTIIPLEYRDDVTTNAIVIGGSSLARGYTVIGLSVTYFLRNTVFYDTLMQMARWFGYRTGYEDLCRIFLPTEQINAFADIIISTEELVQAFKDMAEIKLTPNDFGLCVRENPGSLTQITARKLQVTARNKQKHVRELIHTITLDGTLKETSYLSTDQSHLTSNLDAINTLIADLSNGISVTGGYIWRSVDKNKVLGFLQTFRTFDKDTLGLSSRMPIGFIKQYAEEQDTQWDVSLHSGTGDEFSCGDIKINKQRRSIKKEDNYCSLQNRQVSSESAEAIVFKGLSEHDDQRMTRGEVRSRMPRPLLMLHILEPKEDFEIKELAAFGVSFPGNVSSRKHVVTIKINTVYYKNLMKDLENENQSDD